MTGPHGRKDGPMSEGRTKRFRFSLGRLFLWAAVVGAWLGILVDAGNDSVHGRSWFSAILAMTVLVALTVGQVVERRVKAEAHKIEWTLLWVGVGTLLAPIAYRLLISG
jgi:hypothetical protein